MAAILEGHTQAVSKISRDNTVDADNIYLSLSILDSICPLGWRRDKKATEDMPRWIHERTGAGQWDFPNLMEFAVTTRHGQPLQPNTTDDWDNTIQIWAPMNCTMNNLTHLLLEQHLLGSLPEFRYHSMVALQQHTPQGMRITPHFFNYGDTEVDTKNRRISHLIHRATCLQAPGASRHPFPCQRSDNHPIKSGTAQRTELLAALIRSTSFTLTIYTVPYPQGHSGPQANGHPLMATPFLFDRRDAKPVYRLMYQTFSDSLHD